MDNNQENIKIIDIPGFPSYGASCDGRIWSKRTNHWYDRKDWRQLKPWLSNCGYLLVALTLNGKTYKLSVHRIIYITFIGPITEKMYVCHNNGIRTDNRIENLRMDTASNNQLDRQKHGTDSNGEHNIRAKLTNEEIKEIRQRYKNGETQLKISQDYNTTRRNISDIVNYVSWKHIE